MTKPKTSAAITPIPLGKINQFARENDVEQATPMHGWIIGYLYRHRDTPVFQRDIEREFSITRSTVTNILQLMERKGYIERRSVPQDARLKQLVLTEEGICFHEKTMLCFHQTDDYVAGLLTAEENTESGHSIARPIALRATGSHPSGRSSEKLPAHRPGKMHISRAIYRKSVR